MDRKHQFTRRARLAAPGYVALAAGLAMLALAAVGHAAPKSNSNSNSHGADIDSRIATLKKRIDSVKDDQSLSDAERKKVASDYESAISALQGAQANKKKTAKLKKTAEDAPARIKSLTQKRDQVRGQPARARDLSTLSESDLTDRANKLERELASERSKLSDLREHLSKLAKRPATAHDELTSERKKINARADEPTGAAGSAAGSAGAQAANALTEARQRAGKTRIAYLQQVISTIDVRKRLAEAEHALAETRVNRLSERLSQVDQRLSEKRSTSAQSLENRAQQRLEAFKNSTAIVQKAAQTNYELAKELAQRIQRTQTLGQQRGKERSQLESLKQRLNLVRQQLQIGAGSVALGNLLRSQKRALPDNDVAFWRASPPAKVPDLASVQLEHFQYRQRLATLNNLQNRARALADQGGINLDADQLGALVEQLRLRRQLIEQMVDADGRYVDIGRSLRDLSSEDYQTRATFSRLLDEKLFWLPTSEALDATWFASLGHVVPQFFSVKRWAHVAVSFASGVRARPFLAVFAIIFIVTLYSVTRILSRRLSFLAQPVGNVGDDNMWLTLRAAAITLLLVLPAGLSLLIGGYLIRAAPSLDAFVRAAGVGISQTGVLVLFLNLFIQTSRPDGLADAHFKWPGAARRGLNRSLLWLLGVLLLPSLIISMSGTLDNAELRDTLGRGAFMISSLVIAAFAWRLFHPKRGVLSHVFAPTVPRWRFGYLWLPVGMITPLALACLAGLGYYDTALQLQTRFFYSVGLVGGVVIFYSVIVRWLTVAERRLALEKARKRRAEARAARDAAAAGEAGLDLVNEQEIGLPQISEQTRGLIQIVMTLISALGLWLIWSNTLPALQFLDQITLWHHTTTIKGEVQSTNITLGALLLALVVGVVTALAGRNLPGFMEITILRRFSINAGSRYAIATLFKYAIVIVGLLIAIGLIGFRWSSIQWLVAALGVGLGFGLQAIFANFISGIIILFERPVRVGDIATVGDLTGLISQVRIRATTVTDWDNREVIIPNQTFVTQTVTNWTLSDDIARMVVNVRVDYESDTNKVEQLIRGVIDAQPQVLDDPPSSVYLVAFDHSGLVYNGRVYYRDPYNNWMPLQHALYTGINEAFSGQDVRITFEQRDLHLRSMDESVAGVLGDRQSREKSDTPAPADHDGPAQDPSESKNRSAKPSGQGDGDAGPGDAGGGN